MLASIMILGFDTMAIDTTQEDDAFGKSHFSKSQFVGIAGYVECRYLCHHKQNNRQT